VEGLAHTVLVPFEQVGAASWASDYMAQAVVMDMAVAPLGDSNLGSTCYCYCTSADPGPGKLGYIGHVAHPCYTVLVQQHALDSCGLEPVRPGLPELPERLERLALAVCSEPQLVVAAGFQVPVNG
jgi:hypothetical protein